MVSPIKVFIKFVCKLPFTFYFYSLIQFFNFRTKIPLRSRKTAIAQTPTPPNGHWPFCVTKVGMDVVPNLLSKTYGPIVSQCVPLRVDFVYITLLLRKGNSFYAIMMLDRPIRLFNSKEHSKEEINHIWQQQRCNCKGTHVIFFVFPGLLVICCRAVNPPFLEGRLPVLKAASLPPYFKRNLPVFENK